MLKRGSAVVKPSPKPILKQENGRSKEEQGDLTRVLRVQAKKNLQDLEDARTRLAKHNFIVRTSQAQWKPIAGCKGKDCFCQRKEGKKP